MVAGPRNHERHCRNAVAFACLKKRSFREAVPRFAQLPFRIASGSPDNLGTSPFVDASAYIGTYKRLASLRQSQGAYQGGQSGRLVMTAGVIEKISRE